MARLPKSMVAAKFGGNPFGLDLCVDELRLELDAPILYKIYEVKYIVTKWKRRIDGIRCGMNDMNDT